MLKQTWKQWLSALMGAWFIISPWVLSFQHQTAALWTSIVIGAIQLIASVWGALTRDTGSIRLWMAAISLITGVWFVIQPFAFAQNTVTTWVTAVLGVITALLNVWNLVEDRGTRGVRGGQPKAA
ncbi:MAG: SPW repeat protein [Thermoflavifilum sp.]|nr:SPW repeat protein [Thermoflavifilum sp.]MCL6514133.1 SPW repeat protein [Alicyclobacillus sp.]